MTNDSVNTIAVVLCAPLLGLALRASLRLLYGARGPAPGDTVHLMVSVFAWVLISVSLLASVVLVWPLLVILAYASLDTILAHRDRSKRLAWSLVSGAAGRGQPLRSAVEVGRERLEGAPRRAFDRFAADLADGAEPAPSIAVFRQAFPREAQAVAALAKGGDVDLLAVDGLADPMFGEALDRVIMRLAYFAWLLAMMTFLLTFMLLYIAPSMQEIFDEFGLSLPWMTEAVIAVSDLLVSGPIAGLMVLLGLVIALWLVVLWLAYLLGFHPLRPLYDRLFFAGHRARLLRLLAAALEAGLPLGVTLERLTTGRPREPCGVARRKLRRAAWLAESGADWRDALRQSGLLTPRETPLLAAAEQAGNLPWALRALADRAASRSVYRWEAVMQFVFPLVTVLIGLAVLGAVVGFFLPLVELINGLV